MLKKQVHYWFMPEYIESRISVIVQSLSHIWLFGTLWTAAFQASLSSTISQSLLKLMSIVSVMPSNHLILCCPLLLLPSIFPSIRIFSNELVLHIKWLNYWSFSISPSSEYSGLISFRTNWFDLLSVQGILKSSLAVETSTVSGHWKFRWDHICVIIEKASGALSWRWWTHTGFIHIMLRSALSPHKRIE